MNKTKKLTFCGIMAALAVAVMFGSYFPYLTYAIPAVSGAFIMIVVIEINRKWALAAYIASAVPVFFFAETESKLLYILLFGYYSVVKAWTESFRKPVIEWIVKIGVFNIAILSAYLFFSKLFGISLEDFDVLGKYGALIFLLAGNVVFVLYDIAVSRLAMFYIYVVKPKLKF